jgi:hypothetical protein
MARITVSYLRKLLAQFQNDEITFARIVELLNEKAAETENKKA